MTIVGWGKDSPLILKGIFFQGSSLITVTDGVSVAEKPGFKRGFMGYASALFSSPTLGTARFTRCWGGASGPVEPLKGRGGVVKLEA